MPDLANDPSPDQQFFAQVLSKLAERFATPTDDLPGVRCISRPVLTRILKDILHALDLPGFRDTSARTLIDQLVFAGVVTPVPLESIAGSKPRYHLYGVGFGTSIERLDPIELLLAAVPTGVICYFTALQVHGLTTQLPPFYHVAQRTSVERGARSTYVDSLQAVTSDSSRVDKPRLGTLMFVRQTMPYYLTRRDRRWLRDIQVRYLNDKTRFHVTTLEQTLLDTLHRPASCGGPAVVFETWETAREQLNLERLTMLLRDINDAHLTRRVGYMLERFEYSLDQPSIAVLHEVQHDVMQRPSDLIPLFPGIPYEGIDARWGLWAEWSHNVLFSSDSYGVNVGPDVATAWRQEALDHIFAAFAVSGTLAANLIFKGARVLNARLHDEGRQSLDLDTNLTTTFLTAFPTREQQIAALQEATERALLAYFTSQNPVRYEPTRVRVTSKPTSGHPWGWDAFIIEIGLNDRQHQGMLGFPRLTVDVAAPEPLGPNALAPLEIDHHAVNAYTLARIAGEKLRAFLTSLPAYRAKLGGRGDTVRVKDLYDLARIDGHVAVDDNEFWRTAGDEFRIACASRYVDCYGLESFAQHHGVTRTTYVRDATLAGIPFEEAWSVVDRIAVLFKRLKITPFVFPLPRRDAAPVGSESP
jgi:hypothetical protein